MKEKPSMTLIGGPACKLQNQQLAALLPPLGSVPCSASLQASWQKGMRTHAPTQSAPAFGCQVARCWTFLISANRPSSSDYHPWRSVRKMVIEWSEISTRGLSKYCLLVRHFLKGLAPMPGKSCFDWELKSGECKPPSSAEGYL